MSLDGQYDPDNVFAKILRGEIPNATIYEDDETLCFMDAFPQSKGHCLVIPKSPSRNLLDTQTETLTKLSLRTQAVAKAVRKALNPDGIVITQFNGAPAGQTVFHLHFHIIPRYNHEQLASHAGTKMADFEDLKLLAQKIAAEL